MNSSRAMQYSYTDSEDGAGGSSLKRHSGGGREIHLKFLIPRLIVKLCGSLWFVPYMP